MCGLVGAISHELSAGEVSIFEDLMLVSTLRGRRGSGIIGVPKNASAPLSIVKSAGQGSEIIYTKDYKNIENKKFSCLIGHTRYPTSGGIGREFAHPIEHKHIIGVMNGSLEVVGQKVLKKEFDAQLFFREVADRGLHQAALRADGPIAVVFVHKGDNTLNFYRNTKRPLYFAYPETYMDTVYWASEIRMLELILSRRLNDKYKIIGLPAHEHWRFDLRTKWDTVRLKDSVTFKDVQERDQKAEEIRMKEAEEERLKKLGASPAQTVLALPPPANANRSVVVPREGGKEGYHTTMPGHSVDSSELERLLIAGCSNCTMPASYHSYLHNELTWWKAREFMCEPCYEHDPMARQIADQALGRK